MARFPRIFFTVLRSNWPLSPFLSCTHTNPGLFSPPKKLFWFYILNISSIYFSYIFSYHCFWLKRFSLYQIMPPYNLLSSLSYIHRILLGSLVTFTKASNGPAWVCVAYLLGILIDNVDNEYWLDEAKTYPNHCGVLQTVPLTSTSPASSIHHSAITVHRRNSLTL